MTTGNQGGYGANKYQRTSVQTASPGQILILLYEGAVKNVKKATEFLERGDLAGKGLHIGKAHDIINELTNTLNFEVGGDIARNLERLYNFMIEQLVKANLEGADPGAIDKLRNVQRLLESLLSGWREAVSQVQKAQSKISVKG